MSVTLHLGHEGEESITFVRAVLPALLRWDEPLSPTHGFHRSMVICGVDAEDETTSALEALLEVSQSRYPSYSSPHRVRPQRLPLCSASRSLRPLPVIDKITSNGGVPRFWRGSARGSCQGDMLGTGRPWHRLRGWAHMFSLAAPQPSLSPAQVLHHTQGTVLLDQLLMLVPFLLIGGWQIGGGGANSALLVLAAVFVGLLIIRLIYLGLIVM